MGNGDPSGGKPPVTLLLLATSLATVTILSVCVSPDFPLSIVSAQSNLLASEQPKMSIVEKPDQPSTSETDNRLAGNLNQSSSTPISLSNTTIDNSMQALGREAVNPTSQPSNSQAMSALQPQQQPQQHQNDFPPYQQQYSQYPTQQLQQNQQFSYPSNNITNIPGGTGLQQSASSLPEGAPSTLQQPAQQQQLPPNLLTGIQPSMGASLPETFIISAIDNNGQNILSGSTVSSQFISLIFTGTDDVGYIIDYQCSYDGQPPYSCTSPFTIDNSLVVIPTNVPIVPNNNNTHTLLISAVDSSRNVDQTPASFVWTIVGVQGSTETIPGQEPLSSALPLTVPQTELAAETSELSQQPMSQQAEAITQESLYSNVPSVEP